MGLDLITEAHPQSRSEYLPQANNIMDVTAGAVSRPAHIAWSYVQMLYRMERFFKTLFLERLQIKDLHVIKTNYVFLIKFY